MDGCVCWLPEIGRARVCAGAPKHGELKAVEIAGEEAYFQSKWDFLYDYGFEATIAFTLLSPHFRTELIIFYSFILFIYLFIKS